MRSFSKNNLEISYFYLILSRVSALEECSLWKVSSLMLALFNCEVMLFRPLSYLSCNHSANISLETKNRIHIYILYFPQNLHVSQINKAEHESWNESEGHIGHLLSPFKSTFHPFGFFKWVFGRNIGNFSNERNDPLLCHFFITERSKGFILRK